MRERHRRWISYVVTILGLLAMFRIYSQHWDPVGYMMIGFFIAPLILPFLRLGRDGVRIMLLSSITVALAAFLLPYVYLGILTPVVFLCDPEAQFIIIACVLAPIFEELVKGSLWIIEKGDWRHGAAIGLGFGCFEATSYLMVYGVDIAFLRWQGTILHVVASAMMFRGLSMKRWRCFLTSIIIHIAYNSWRYIV